MKIYIASHSGFCYGVKRAIDMALTCAENSGKAMTLGPIIHNPQMVDHLGSKGIGVANSLADITHGTVILRSHGVGPQIYKMAEEKDLRIIDATCPHVKKAQMAAKRLSEQGYPVVIIGEKNHPEVKSIVEWAGNNPTIVETEQEALVLPRNDKLGVVAQTTFSGELFERIIEILRSKSIELKIDRTICTATDLRQSETIELAKKVGVLIVVGGKNSANTTRLAELGRNTGCTTYHIETAAELDREWFKNKKSAGITAGASTPSWLIEEVYYKMQEFNQELDPTLKSLESGNIIQGKVVAVRKDEVFVDIGYKAEGVIPLAELAFPVPEQASDVVAEGQVIDVYVVETENAEGNVKLSKVKADKVVAWDKLEDAKEKSMPIEVQVIDAVKGGVSVSVFGIRGFIPASQLDLRFTEDLSVYAKQVLQAVVIDLDREKQKVVLSRRILLEQQKAEQEQKAYATLAVGSEVKAKITRLADFGAFADIGGAEGLIHISDMSWERVKHPSEIVSVGDEVLVHILKVDSKAKRISLSLKENQKDPWTDKAAVFTEGKIVPGKITKIAKFGAFVEIGAGIEGLVHLSELADRRVATADEIVKIGQEVAVKVLSIDKNAKKISLSIKQAQEEKERAEYSGYLNAQSGLGVTLADKFGHLFKRED